METFSALLALCEGNSPVTGEFPSQKPVTWSFDIFVDLRLNKRLGKESRRHHPHYDVTVISPIIFGVSSQPLGQLLYVDIQDVISLSMAYCHICPDFKFKLMYVTYIMDTQGHNSFYYVGTMTFFIKHYIKMPRCKQHGYFSGVKLYAHTFDSIGLVIFLYFSAKYPASNHNNLRYNLVSISLPSTYLVMTT